MNQNTQTDDTIDLKELFFSLISQWKLISVCTILSLIIGLLYLRLTPDTYQVNALVQVEETKGASAALLGDLSNLMDAKQPAQTEIEILKSRLVLGSVINKLNLDVEIKPKDISLLDRLIDQPRYSIEYQSNGITFSNDTEFFEIQKFNVPTAYQNKELQLTLSGQKFELIDTKLEIVLLSGSFNQEVNKNINNDEKFSLTIMSNKPLQKDFTIIKKSLPSAVDSLLSNYSVAERGKLTGIIGLNYQGEDADHIVQVLNEVLIAYTNQNIERRSAETAQTLKFLDDQLPELKQQLDQAERAFNTFREQHNTVDVTKESELYLNQSVQFEKQKIELEQKYAEVSAQYTSAHPIMQQMDAQIKVVNEKINELESTLKQLPDLQRRYLQLYREVEVKQQLYTALLNSYQQLRIAKAGEIGNVRVIDTAVKPSKPIKPKQLIILVLSLLIGGFIGTLLALLRNMLRSGIKDASEIEEITQLPVYATVPRSPLQESHIKRLKKKSQIPLLALRNSNDIAIESIRNIRTALHFSLNQDTKNIISISGPSPEVGKSFITVNLAAIFSQNEKRVLVIDGDLRRGYLHKYFNQSAHNGLTELLMDKISIEDAIQRTEIENLFFLSRGKSPTNPSELLSSNKFIEFLNQVAHQYDYILIDTPPTLAVTDGLIIAQQANINLLVVRHAKTQMKELEITQARFEQANVKINGVILNDVQNNYGYGYGYGYGYNYQYSYTSNQMKDD